MVAQSPPYALQNAQHSAALFRQAVSSVWRGGMGVIAAGELAVAAQSTPNMSITVAAGRAWIPGTQVSNVSGGSFSPQAAYFGLNDAPVTVTIAAADPTNPRIDAVYVAVADAFYSGSTNTLTIGVVTGTPAASPSAPAIPSNGLLLATVAVAANATQVTSSNIAVSTTATYPAAARGGILTVPSTDTTAGTHDGAYRDLSGRGLQRWDAGTSTWRYGAKGPRFRISGANITCVASADTAWTSFAASPTEDTDGMWQSNKSVIIPVSGRYLLGLLWCLGGTTAFTTPFFLRVIKAAVAGQTTPPTNAVLNVGTVTGAVYAMGAKPVNLNAGDTLSLQYWTSQASLQAGGTSFGTPSEWTIDYLSPL